MSILLEKNYSFCLEIDKATCGFWISAWNFHQTIGSNINTSLPWLCYNKVIVSIQVLSFTAVPHLCVSRLYMSLLPSSTIPLHICMFFHRLVDQSQYIYSNTNWDGGAGSSCSQHQCSITHPDAVMSPAIWPQEEDMPERRRLQEILL